METLRTPEERFADVPGFPHEPNEPDDPASADNRAAWAKLAEWDKPFHTVFNSDPITSAMAPAMQRKIPGAIGVDHLIVAGHGHFIQEDSGDELAGAIAAFLG